MICTLLVLSFRTIIHYFLHLIFPAVIAKLFFNKPKGKWGWNYLLMLATIIVDLDHLLAVPIFDPNRCSIGFHPLHSYYAIAVYVLLLLPKKTRVIGIGLTLHMLTDFLDCLWIFTEYIN